MPALPWWRKKTGVYLVRNMVNGKGYVGKSTNKRGVNERVNSHKNRLRNNVHENQHLQRAWVKYGEDTFLWGIIDYYPPDKCSEMEQYWIAQFGTFGPGGYNMTKGGEGVLGYTPTAEVTAKVSMANTGQKRSIESRSRMSLAQMGNKKNLGHKHTAEAIAKMRVACRGRKHTPETIAKIVTSHAGVKHTLETRAKIGLAHIGKKHSAESRAKMRESQRKRRALAQQAAEQQADA